MRGAQAVPLSKQTPYFYVVDITLAASSTGEQALILDNDSEFDLYGIEAVTDQDGSLAADTSPVWPPENFAMRIENQTSGRFFMSDFVRRGNICGKSFINFLAEARPIRFPRKQQLIFSFENLIAAQIAIQVVLKGYKIYSGSLGA